MVKAHGIDGTVDVCIDPESIPLPDRSPGLIHLDPVQCIRKGKPVKMDAVVFRDDTLIGTHLILYGPRLEYYGFKLREPDYVARTGDQPETVQ